MRAHWESLGTRKLNKHYQSGGRSPVPLWTDFSLIGLGCTLVTPADPTLTLRPDGLFLNLGSTYAYGRIEIPPLNGSYYVNYPYDKVILCMLSLNGLTFNGYPMPIDYTTTLRDSTGKIKFDIDTVDFTYTDSSSRTFNYSARCVIVYVDYADYPKTATGWGRFSASNCKFNKSFRFPLASPLTIGLDRTGCLIYDSVNNTVTTGSYSYSKDFYYIDNGTPFIGGNAPKIGSSINSDSPISISNTQGTYLSAVEPWFNGLYFRDDMTGQSNLYNLFEPQSDISADYGYSDHNTAIGYSTGSGSSRVTATWRTYYTGELLSAFDTIDININADLLVNSWSGCSVVRWS